MNNYTAKKVLPRLLIAAVLINLSIYLVALALDIANVIGAGIYSLITTPFGAGAHMQNGLNLHLNIGLLGQIGIAGGAIWAVASHGFIHFLLMGILVPALLIIIAVLITLIVRQAIIFLLIFVSPIAFALYTLPNTEQYFRKWWDWLFRALMIYPIVAALFAVSNVLAATLDKLNLGDLGSAAGQILAVAALFAPLLLIPFAFRFAGGLIGQLHNAVHARTAQPNLEKAQKTRAARRQQRNQDWHAGSLFQDRGFGAVINNVGRRAGVGRAGRFGVGRTGRNALALATQAQNQEALRNNPRLNELRNQDAANAVLALSGGTRAGARQAMRDLFTDENGNYDAAAAEAAYAGANAVGFTRQNAAAALQTVAQNKSRAIRAGDIQTVQRGINRLAGSNTQEAENIAYSYQYFSREAGRGDLGGAWHHDISAGRNALQAQAAAHGLNMSTEEAARHVTSLDGIGRTEVASMVRGYPQQMQQYASTIRTMMDHGTPEQREKAAQHLLEMQKALPYASDTNKDIINRLMTGGDIGGVNRAGFVRYEDQRSIEDQLGEQVVGAAAGAGAAHQAGLRLSRSARVYDRESGMGLAGPGNPLGGGAPPPPPAGP